MPNFRTRTIHTDEKRTVIVIESFASRRDSCAGMLGFSAISKPVAIVVVSSAGAQAVDTNGSNLDLEQLLHDTNFRITSSGSIANSFSLE